MGVPWFKFFPQQYLTDSKVRQIAREHRSILLDLWCYCAMDGSIPESPEAIARLIGESVPATKKAMAVLKAFFVQEGDRLISKRIQTESEAYQEKCQKLRESASKGGLKKAANAIANARSDEYQTGQQMLEQTLEQTLKQNPAEAEAEEEKEKDVPAPLEPARRPRKVAPKKPAPDSLPEILGKDLVNGACFWPDFWELSAIWPESSNIRKKDSARAYVKARQDASHDCILRWAEWTLKECNGKITTLSAWLENQDWSSREAQWSQQAVSA